MINKFNTKVLNKYDIVSFDIFDTLVERIISKPVDVFKLIEKIDSSYSSFSKYRTMAEKSARAKKEGEVTLDDIYLELNKYYSNDCLEKIKEEEIRIEKKLSLPRKSIKSIYDYCIEQGKRIIIISDMYLPFDVIIDVLCKCGYDKFEKLYLSSQIGKTKSKGDLFKFVLDDLNIDSQRIIHIGDNKESDYNKPREYGIESIIVSKNKKAFDENILFNILKNLAMCRFGCENVNSLKKLGYITFGPILYSYSKWVHDVVCYQKIEKLFFLSRDGYTIKAAYNLLYPNENCHYMLASRRALSVPVITREVGLKELLKLLNISGEISKNIFLKKTGIRHEANYNVDEDNILFAVGSAKATILYDKYKDQIYDNAEREARALSEYLQNIHFYGKVGIVDIGWFGNMQNYLKKFCEKNCIAVNITGLYVGKRSARKDLNMNGFLFDEYKNQDIRTAIDSMNSLFESCFLANHGSLLSYLNGGTFEGYEYDENELKAMREFQEGALCLVKDISSMGLSEIINLSEHESFALFRKHFCYPSLAIAKKFGDLPFYDTELTYIAKPKKIGYYLMHIRMLISDFSKCRWKIGFLTRLTNIQYIWFVLYRLYYFLVGSIKNGK